MPQRTRYQERIIRNYYQNRGAIALQRAQELLSELYLTTGKRRAQHWKNLAGHLEALGLKQEQIDHLIAQDNPEVVATVLNKLAIQD
jgi:heme oxygenase